MRGHAILEDGRAGDSVGDSVSRPYGGAGGAMELVEPGGEEWETMWAALGVHPLNEGLTDPKEAEHEGEVWQYMGMGWRDGAQRHCFRHRLHPKTGRREYVYLAV